jgi:hypothetical protein
VAASGPWGIEAYRTPAGACPLQDFIQSLAGQDEVDANALVKLIEERGNQLRVPQSKALGKGLYELRRNQVRIFYMFGPGRRMVTLLSGIVKKQDRIPQGVLDTARTYKTAVEAQAKRVKR